MANEIRTLNVGVDTRTAQSNLAALGAAFGSITSSALIFGTALYAVAAAAVNVTKSFLEFEKNVIRINTLLPKSERETAKVKEQLLELKKALPNQEYQDLSESVYILTSLLQDSGAAFTLAADAGKAAIATNTTAEVTTNALTKAMKVFNMTTEEGLVFLDDYVAAVNAGVISGDKLGQNFGEAAIAMSGLNGSAVETLALFSQLAPALQEEQIKTGIKGVYVEMEKNKEKFEEAGIATDNWNQMLDDLEGRDLAKLFPRADALIFIQALLEQKEAYRDLVHEIETTEGDLDEAFTAYSESAAGIFDAAGTSVDDFSIRVGDKFAEIGASFIAGIGQENIDELLNNIIALLDGMVPPLTAIAELIGTRIKKGLEDSNGFLVSIAELLGDINYLFTGTESSAEGVSLSLIDVRDALVTIGNIVNPIYWIFKLLEAVILTIGDALRSWGDLFRGQITLLEHMTNLAGGAMLDNFKRVGKEILGIKEDTEEITEEEEIPLGSFMTKKGGEIITPTGGTITIAADMGDDDVLPGGAGGRRTRAVEAATREEKLIAALDLLDGTMEELQEDTFNLAQAQAKAVSGVDVATPEGRDFLSKVLAAGSEVESFYRDKWTKVELEEEPFAKKAEEVGVGLRAALGAEADPELVQGILDQLTLAVYDMSLDELTPALTDKLVGEGISSYAEAVREREEKLSKEEKEGKDDAAQKRVAGIFTRGIVDAIMSGDVRGALQQMFGAVANTILSHAISSAIIGLLKMIPGFGGFLSFLGFATGGYLTDNKVHYAADGLYLANRTGANVLKHRPGGVPVIAAEAGVDEVNAFAPINDTGYRLMMDEVMPLFPQFNAQMRGLGTVASQSFVRGARAQEAMLTSAAPTFLVDVNPVIGSQVDVAISEAAQRGSRIKSSRTTN